MVGAEVASGDAGQDCQRKDEGDFPVEVPIKHQSRFERLNQSKHHPQVLEPIFKPRRAEEYPTYQDDQHRHKITNDRRSFSFNLFCAQESLEAGEQSMPHSPGNELPAGAMPKTGQKENDQRVGFCAKDLLLPAFELQWIEDVIAEPGAQGYVPATPKIGNVEGKVRN